MASKTKKTRPHGTGSVSKYKLVSGYSWRWQAWVHENPKDPESQKIRIGANGYKTAAEANTAMRQGITERETKSLNPSQNQTTTIATYGAHWLNTLKLAPATTTHYERLLRVHVYPNIGHIKLARLTSQDLAKLYANMANHGRRDTKQPGGKLSPNTINKTHIVIGALLDAAIDDGLINTNPARRSRIVKAPTGAQIRAHQDEINTWNETQLNQYLTWSKNTYKDELYEMWYLIAHTGIRRGEATALKWSDIDWDNQILSIRRAADPILIRQTKTTKTGRQRPVTIHPQLLNVLNNYREHRKQLNPKHVQPDAYIFSLKNGELRSPNDISARWARAMKKALAASIEVDPESPLPFLTLKGLRHTHATLLMKAGANPKIVQERLGHSTISTTMNIYSHVTPTMQRDAVDVLLQRLGAENE